MAAMGLIRMGIEVLTETGRRISYTLNRRIPIGAGTCGRQETVTLTASIFTALSPPAGAKAVAIILGAATSLTLKGVTGDGTGISITPASNPLAIDVLLPLGTSPSIGILNGSASNQTIDVIWL